VKLVLLTLFGRGVKVDLIHISVEWGDHYPYYKRESSYEAWQPSYVVEPGSSI
jgi:hypothetical protein